jgi:hypothetical protein
VGFGTLPSEIKKDIFYLSLVNVGLFREAMGTMGFIAV